MNNQVDRSDEADARRMRWLLAGNGYFMEEECLCGCAGVSTEEDQDDARRRIDVAMSQSDVLQTVGWVLRREGYGYGPDLPTYVGDGRTTAHLQVATVFKTKQEAEAKEVPFECTAVEVHFNIDSRKWRLVAA